MCVADTATLSALENTLCRPLTIPNVNANLNYDPKTQCVTYLK